jgi:hypothetical protein
MHKHALADLQYRINKGTQAFKLYMRVNWMASPGHKVHALLTLTQMGFYCLYTCSHAPALSLSSQLTYSSSFMTSRDFNKKHKSYAFEVHVSWDIWHQVSRVANTSRYLKCYGSQNITGLLTIYCVKTRAKSQPLLWEQLINIVT